MKGVGSKWPTRFRLGVAHGIGVATMFSAYVLINAALGGQAHIELGVPLGVIIPGYFLGGIIGGLIYGALAPLTRWWLGRSCVGFLVMLPIGIGATAMLPDVGLDDREGWIGAVVFALILGGLGGLHFLEPRAPNPEAQE